MNHSQDELLVPKVWDIYKKLSSLPSLKPSQDVNMLFTQLVHLCMPSSPIDTTKLPEEVQEMRAKLIRICGEAEGLLESHFSSILGSYDKPLDHLTLFPYYSNYLKLSHLEFTLLSQHSLRAPNRVAFVGSGPLPLTAIVLATKHLTSAVFHNYDIDSSANLKAVRLVSCHGDTSSRLLFHTTDIMKVSTTLGDYDVVFLAALVGMELGEKITIIKHLATYMAPGAILMLRSAHGARGFLYPVIEPTDVQGFEILTVYHPTDEVINSVIVARKPRETPTDVVVDHQGLLGHQLMMPCKCCEVQAFNPLNHRCTMVQNLVNSED